MAKTSTAIINTHITTIIPHLLRDKKSTLLYPKNLVLAGIKQAIIVLLRIEIKIIYKKGMQRKAIRQLFLIYLMFW